MTELTPGTEEAATGRLRRLALLVEYEGTRYHGFQSQKNAASIQDALEGALFRLTGERKRIRGAGRTDAGVHAQGQVASFDTGALYAPEVFLKAMNHYLPEDISVKDAQEVSPGLRSPKVGRQPGVPLSDSEQRYAVADDAQVYSYGEEAAGRGGYE